MMPALRRRRKANKNIPTTPFKNLWTSANRLTVLQTHLENRECQKPYMRLYSHTHEIYPHQRIHNTVGRSFFGASCCRRQWRMSAASYIRNGDSQSHLWLPPTSDSLRVTSVSPSSLVKIIARFAREQLALFPGQLIPFLSGGIKVNDSQSVVNQYSIY
jgi:hypothetical protein